MKTSLTEFIAGTAANAVANAAEYSDLTSALERINAAYAAVAQESVVASKPHSVLFGMSHASFLTSCALALSGQAPPGYMVSRGALESALYFFWSERKAGSFDIWLRRNDDDAAKIKAKERFRIGPMMTELEVVNDAIGNQYRKAYENTIDFGAHPNYLAFLTNVEEKGGDTTWMAVSAEEAVIRHTIFAVGYAGATCIAVAAATFPKQFGHSSAKAIETVWTSLDDLAKVT